MDKVLRLRQKALMEMDMSKEPDEGEIEEIIDRIILQDEENRYLPLTGKLKLRKEVYDSIRGYGILQDLLEDPLITDIMVNGPDKIFVDKGGKITRFEGKFSSRERLADIIQQIVARSNRRVNEYSPIADTRLEDGSRVNVVLDPVAIEGPAISIRKFPDKKMEMEQLVRNRTITQEAGEYLDVLVKSGYNIFVSGGTGSGKTTFLNVLSDSIPKDERVITIEDSAELQLTGIENLVRLEARQANTEGENEITIRNLIKTALRMQPDRIVVGEVRGAEAIDMLQAMNTGHDGSLSTGHANSPKDLLSRLEVMVLMGMEISLAAIKGQIAAGLDIIVHMGRLRDRSRRVLEVVEVVDYQEGRIILNPLFGYREEQGGSLVRTENKLINRKKLEGAGYESFT
ncbi:CpaF family protein [Parasporobacterium paucivorans]|uniref:Pilus assembly protein CpaF n=1 Tax=Parasporobacterium paucivorans DSM 15970 TaxID=1122934 RepID=A0A1M6JAX7_9FIRM|nr:CpaF family protein [Parasporobacterium paucivorans]SHJ43810.1 pilus assembly protein CpaF [Parasporobacterium paucivorans DSM 15970]